MTKHKPTDKYIEFKKNVQLIIKREWRDRNTSPTIQMIARELGKSTSVAARYLDKMQEEGLVIQDYHNIYTNNLFHAMNAFMDIFWKNKDNNVPFS
jgi:hypothetical protein